MAELAGAPWRADDVSPPPPDDGDKDVILWGTWVHEKPPSRRASRARVRALPAAGPSSSSAAAGPLSPAVPLPPPAPQPTYLVVQRLFRFIEHTERRIMRRLDRVDQMFVALGVELPPLPDSSASEEE